MNTSTSTNSANAEMSVIRDDYGNLVHSAFVVSNGDSNFVSFIHDNEGQPTTLRLRFYDSRTGTVDVVNLVNTDVDLLRNFLLQFSIGL